MWTKKSLKPFDDKSTPVSDSICLQANILEAMYQDTLTVNDTNASAGFDLMSRYIDGDNVYLEEKIDEEWVYNGQHMGVSLCCLAFNEV